MRGAFTAALVLHASLIGAIAIGNYLQGHVDQFGSKDTGAGAVAIEAVTSIPIPHRGETNPLANNSESEVPQAPLEKPKDLEKAEPIRPDAIAIRSKVPKKAAPKESQHQVFRPYSELAKNQLTSKLPPQVSSPLFTRTRPDREVWGERYAGFAIEGIRRPDPHADRGEMAHQRRRCAISDCAAGYRDVRSDARRQREKSGDPAGQRHPVS